MEPTDVLRLLTVLLVSGTGVYLLAFRPLERSAALLGVGLVFLGCSSIFWTGEPTWLGPPRVVVEYLGGMAIVAFMALYPKRMRLRSLSGAALALLLVWTVAMLGYVAREGVTSGGPLTFDKALFHPVSLGAGTTIMLFLLARWTDLPAVEDDEGRAARYFYVVIVGLVLTSGGYLAGKAVAAAAGLTTYPSFLLPSAEPRMVALQFAAWWIVPGAIVAFALARWRWWLPAGLFLAGALTAAPIALRTDLDRVAVLTLRSWGAFVGPALVLYAQARWAPFSGEPASVRSTVAVTAVSALLAYVFAHVLVLVLSPDPTFSAIAAPILGLAAAGGMGVLVLPRARKLALRRVFLAGPGILADVLAPGHVVLGRYRVVRLLAEGGQGRLYEATDARRKGARVVLKAVTNETAMAEARILRDLRHRNIVGFVDVVEVTGLTLLVLEYAEGGNLRDLLARRGGRLPLADALAIADGVLAGLAEAHVRGVVHRDVKPENVLLDAEGVPKLADFGTAREARPGATARVGGLGTLAYLAPEQVRGEPGDARSDVYAAAVLVHEVVAGTRPVATGGDDEFLVRRAILHEPARISLPPEAARLAPVLERALAKDPAARYQDAGGMRAALGGLPTARAETPP